MLGTGCWVVGTTNMETCQSEKEQKQHTFGEWYDLCAWPYMAWLGITFYIWWHREKHINMKMLCNVVLSLDGNPQKLMIWWSLYSYHHLWTQPGVQMFVDLLAAFRALWSQIRQTNAYANDVGIIGVHGNTQWTILLRGTTHLWRQAVQPYIF